MVTNLRTTSGYGSKCSSVTVGHGRRVTVGYGSEVNICLEVGAG